MVHWSSKIGPGFICDVLAGETTFWSKCQTRSRSKAYSCKTYSKVSPYHKRRKLWNEIVIYYSCGVDRSKHCMNWQEN